MLSVLAEGDESHVHPFRRADTQIRARYAAGLLAGCASELALGLDPPTADAERVGLAVLSIGHEHPVADHDVLDRPDRRKLTVEALAFGEESQIEARFHVGEA